MKTIRILLAVHLMSMLAMAQAAQADSVAVILDDSAGMCAYLSNDSTTEYEKLLDSLASSAFGGEALDVYFLSDVETSRGVGSAAIIELERIKSGRSESSKKGRRSTNGSCVLTANDSKMERIFGPDFDGAGLVVLITDFIFDGGNSRGGAGNLFDFVNNFGEHFTNSSSSSQFDPSAGIIGIQASFNGKYYFQEPNKPGLPITNGKRPLYLFWYARNSQLAQRWMTSILNKLSNNGVSTMFAMELLPMPSPFNPAKATFHQRTLGLAETAASMEPNLSYVNLPYEEKLRRFHTSGRKSKRALPENPVTVAPPPVNCFKAAGLDLYFLKACGRKGDREDLFWDWDGQNISAVRLVYTLTGDFQGVKRQIEAGQIRGIAVPNAIRINYETVTDGTATIAITIDRHAGIFDSKPQKASTEIAIEIRETIAFGYGIDLAQLSDWSAQEEPCDIGPECESLQGKTFRFSEFVEALIKQSNRLAASQQASQSDSAWLKFHAVDRFP